MKINKRLEVFGIIFLVVLVGVGLFDVVFILLYGNDLELSSCDLCYKLNPHLAGCENYTPIYIGELNYSNLTILNTSFLYYEK